MIKMIVMLKRRDGMSHAVFVDHYKNTHRPLLESIPETQRFVRRFVVSFPVPAPQYGEPSYDAVVEMWFDSTKDLDGLFFSENFKTKVDPDHENFIDLATFGRIVSQEDVLIGGALPASTGPRT